jgi:hypothetical protein
MDLSPQCRARMLCEERVTVGQQRQSSLAQRSPNPKKKLRESCNNCAISKVKCSKDRPTCKRCEDRAMFCHFSPSMRNGKRRRVPVSDGAAPESNTTSSGSASPHALEAHQNPVPAIQASLDMQYPERENFEDSLMFWDRSFVEFDAELDNPTDYVSGTGQTFAHICYSEIGHADPDCAETLDPKYQYVAALTPTVQVSPVVPTIDFPAQQSNITSSVADKSIQSSHDCMTIALNISQVLHRAHQKCTWFSPSLLSHVPELD